MKKILTNDIASFCNFNILNLIFNTMRLKGEPSVSQWALLSEQAQGPHSDNLLCL